ncbi:DNA-binding protein [Pseudomonas citronellolis]|uniref:DNA-binding protein n=1 Tax=Pseudomonas citronellolis TaxID=53408 RepID=UPI0023E3A285|nr:DNA-binding protein [Pseudomonas citronellolis]MDF3932958.1 DNA-binding protein [Pseudomonas citronellolis]
MATQQKPKTTEQVKQAFRASGTTVTQWALANNFPPNAVYQVLNGFSKGHYGQAHEIAVALGLKLAAVAA